MKSIPAKIISLSREKKFTAKVLSLILALILWAYLNNSKTGKLKFEATVEFRNLSSGHAISSVSEKIISVTVEGKKEYLKSVDIKSLTPFVNLENPRIDENWAYQIQINRQQVPDSIGITLSADKTKITVEKKLQKRVKVMPVLTGELNTGYVAGRIKTVPESIDITGARSFIEKINHISTEAIPLDGNQGDITRAVDLKAPSQDIELSEVSANVTISIMKVDDLFFLDVPVMVKNYTHEFRHTLATEKVKVYLRKGARMKAVPSDIDISINVLPIEKMMKEKKIKSLESEMPVSVIIKLHNGDTELINFSPDIIKVNSELVQE